MLSMCVTYVPRSQDIFEQHTVGLLYHVLNSASNRSTVNWWILSINLLWIITLWNLKLLALYDLMKCHCGIVT